MYFLFVDESGSPPKINKAKGQYMVLGGVIVPEGAWHQISKEFSILKERYEITGEIKWKYFSTGYKRDDSSLSHLDQKAKDRLRSEIFNIITRRKSTKIIASVCSIEACYGLADINTQEDIYHLGYKGLTERFQYFLQDATRTTGQPQLGIVVCDHRMSADDQRLRAKHHSLVEGTDSHTSKYDNFIETVFFAPSHFSVGIQLADMVAGAINRSYQYNDSKCASTIKAAFRTSPQGQISGYGLVKTPTKGFIEPPGGEAEASPSR